MAQAFSFGNEMQDAKDAVGGFNSSLLLRRI